MSLLSTVVRFTPCHRPIGHSLWTLFGVLSYITFWIAIGHTDDGQSYSAVSELHRRARRQERRQELQKQTQQQQVVAAEEQRDASVGQQIEVTEQEGLVRETTTATIITKNDFLQYFRQRGTTKRRETQHTEPLFDWTFWSLVLVFVLMSYARIRSEPTRQQRRRQRRRSGGGRNRHHYQEQQSRRRRTSGQPMAIEDENFDDTEAIQTLRRMNRDREARGERPISLETYRTLRHVLLHDRPLLQSWIGQTTVPQPRRGATREQLELLCQEYTISERDMDEEDHSSSVIRRCNNECSICLTSFEVNDRIRILPCKHAFHKDCIDHWFQQSTLCPMCKHSLDDCVDGRT